MTEQSKRMRARAVVLGLAVMVGVTTIGASGSVASAPRADASGRSYLAIGDSIPLGYSPLLEEPWLPERFIGYPELIGQQTGMTTTNLACPGQTAQALVSRTAVDAGCFEARDSARYEGTELLHVHYDGIQLHAALEAVRSDQPPSLISIQAGGNEVSLCADAGNPAKCLATSLPKVTASLRQVATELRDAGARGRIVIVGYHLVPGMRPELRRLNAAVKRAARQSHVAYADAAARFDRYARRHNGDLCETGLLVQAPDGSCDLHPSPTGQRLLAEAVLAARR
jgi:lysophospholipase L1-like esterase